MGKDYKRYHNSDIDDVYTFWQSKIGATGIPARADIDPVHLRAWIPSVLLAQALFDDTGRAHDFFFRVAGAFVGERYGHDLTRRHLSDVSLDHQNANVLANFQAPIESRRPVYSINRFYDDTGVLRSFETLLLPLTSDGRVCDMVLGVVMPLPKDFDAPEGVWIYDADNRT